MGKQFSIQDKKRAQALLDQGLSMAEVARRIGCSYGTIQSWVYGVKGKGGTRPTKARGGTGSVALHKPGYSDPKDWDELDPLGQEMLGDFGLFAEKVFCRRVPPWRKYAADLAVEMIQDKSERHYIVCNLPPGSGKTTLWTMDIPAWLMAGGGFRDPRRGRRMRFLLGHEAQRQSKHYVARLMRVLESSRPYYDMEQSREADVVMSQVYGRFKPLQALGDVELWQQEQFIVAQLEDIDLAEKEPTVQAVSRKSTFLGERCEYAVWDDLVTVKNSNSVEQLDALAEWFEKEAEPRVEPGGVLWLVGQRLGPLDLFKNRLDVHYIDAASSDVKSKYVHIVFPAHHESTCDGNHRQWDGNNEGCLLDEVRLPANEIMKESHRPQYRTIYQQEDTDPASSLISQIWLTGGTGLDGTWYPGCYDEDRGFFQHPPLSYDLVDYACVDPSVSGSWAIEWWAAGTNDGPRYLIAGKHTRMRADELIDWDEDKHKFVGLMENWEKWSIAAGTPIRVWVIEANAAQRWLFQFRHFRRWREKYPWLAVLPHQTQRNKLDPELGVEAKLKGVYRQGLKRLPRRRAEGPNDLSALLALNYLQMKERELTIWPRGATDDTVMADWFGETNLEEILRLGRKPITPVEIPGADKLPPYLMAQRYTGPKSRALR